MKKLIAIAAMLMGSQAFADGFVCYTTETDLKVQIYNHVSPEDGTRNGAIMVLSNPNYQRGNRTIAKFTDTKSTLANSGATYVADVDLRVSESSRQGELISGTKLGQLDTIIMDVDFSYSKPVAHGDEMGGTLTLVKRDGTRIVRNLSCERYLKN